jgi:DNA-binding XRE family transcriptional regulator
MEFEGSSPEDELEKWRLRELEHDAEVCRSALDAAARRLNCVVGETPARLLRSGSIEAALNLIRGVGCSVCGSRHRVLPYDGVLLCQTCRWPSKRKERSMSEKGTVEVVTLVEAVGKESTSSVEGGMMRHATREAGDAMAFDSIQGKLAGFVRANGLFGKAVYAVAGSPGSEKLWRELMNADADVARARAAVLDALGAAPAKASKAPPAPKKVEKPEAAPKSKPEPKPAATKKAPSGSFANWLKVVRLRSGLSQKDFGKKVGASYTQMFHWEKGTRLPPDEMVRKIEKEAGEASPVSRSVAAAVS